MQKQRYIQRGTHTHTHTLSPPRVQTYYKSIPTLTLYLTSKDYNTLRCHPFADTPAISTQALHAHSDTHTHHLVKVRFLVSVLSECVDHSENHTAWTRCPVCTAGGAAELANVTAGKQAVSGKGRTSSDSIILTE